MKSKYILMYICRHNRIEMCLKNKPKIYFFNTFFIIRTLVEKRIFVDLNTFRHFCKYPSQKMHYSFARFRR